MANKQLKFTEYKCICCLLCEIYFQINATVNPCCPIDHFTAKSTVYFFPNMHTNTPELTLTCAFVLSQFQPSRTVALIRVRQ